MRRVILESPFAAPKGTRPWMRWYRRYQNKLYARKCVRDSLLRGEAPLVSHLLYTQRGILRDDVATERLQGIKAGHAWVSKADAMVVYSDRGISPGMMMGIKAAREAGIPVEQRFLDSSLARETDWE